jgi:hypothetical protein
MELGIDRNQIIDARILHGMPAVVEHGHIRSARCTGKADGGVLHAGLIEIDPQDGVEAGALEGSGHVLGAGAAQKRTQPPP